MTFVDTMDWPPSKTSRRYCVGRPQVHLANHSLARSTRATINHLTARISSLSLHAENDPSSRARMARVFINPTTPPRPQPNVSRNFTATHQEHYTIQYDCITFLQSTPKAVKMHNNCPKCSASISEGTKTCGSCGSVRLSPFLMPCLEL